MFLVQFGAIFLKKDSVFEAAGAVWRKSHFCPQFSGGKREANVVLLDHCSLDAVGLGNLAFISLTTISHYTVYPLHTQEGNEGSLCGGN